MGSEVNGPAALADKEHEGHNGFISGITEYKALLPDIVESAIAPGVNVRLVDMHVIGSENLGFDGIHPTDTGYDLIADCQLDFQ